MEAEKEKTNVLKAAKALLTLEWTECTRITKSSEHLALTRVK